MNSTAKVGDQALGIAGAIARHRVAGPAVILGGVAAIGAGMWFANPTTPGGVIPPCPSNALLHINCPGCGLSRAVDSLLHADVGAALQYNAVGVVALALLAVVFVQYTVSLWRNKPMRRWLDDRHVPTVIVTVLLAWFVIRNIPVEPFSSLKV